MSVSESMKEHALPQQYTVGAMANTETHQYTLWNCILQSRGVLGHLPCIGWHHQWLIYVTGVRVMRKTQKSPSIHHYNPYNWDSWPLCLLWLALYFFLCLDGWLVLFFFVFFFSFYTEPTPPSNGLLRIAFYQNCIHSLAVHFVFSTSRQEAT